MHQSLRPYCRYNSIGGKGKGGVDIDHRYAASIVSSRLKLQGFIVTDYESEFEDGVDALTRWFYEGKLQNKETVVAGLENAGKAFEGLFEGFNTGKLVVKIAEQSHSKM